MKLPPETSALLQSPDGKKLIEYLEVMFIPPSLIKKKDGIVDPYATLSACGAYEVISLLRRIRDA